MMTVECDGVEVSLLCWPAEAAERDGLTVDGRPRLLLVAPRARPPDVSDPLEDWARVPVDHRDLEVRACRLARIAVARRSPANGVGRTARPTRLPVPTAGSAR